MIIDGNFESLKINDSLDIIDENGTKVLNVTHNEHMPNKLYIKDPSNDIEYLGEIIHGENTEEFSLYDTSSQILHIRQKSGLSMPKFAIVSSFGNFTTKFSLIKRKLILFDGDKEIAAFVGNPPNYRIIIEDTYDTFNIICVAYGMISLLPLKLLYEINVSG